VILPNLCKKAQPAQFCFPPLTFLFKNLLFPVWSHATEMAVVKETLKLHTSLQVA
jgi:hypothetical protein